MEAFAWSQLERRNVDEQLRIIYKRFLVESAMNTERIRALYDICHAYWITTKVPNMKYVHVIAEDGTITQKAPYLEKWYKSIPVCQRRTGLCGRLRMADIIPTPSHMRVKGCSMSCAIWTCAEISERAD